MFRGRSVGRIVHDVLQLLAGLEVRYLFRGNFDARSGFWVATYPGLALPGSEASKPSDFNLVATAKGNESRFAGWAQDGAEIFTCESLDELLMALGGRRFTNVLVEGGSAHHPGRTN